MNPLNSRPPFQGTLLYPLILIALLQIPCDAESTTYYVRYDGNPNCSGLVDAPASADPDLINCAVDRVTRGEQLAVNSGDIIKIYSDTAEGVLYDESVTFDRPGVIVEGYPSGYGFPRIGDLVQELDPNGWTAGSNGTWYQDYSPESVCGLDPIPWTV